MLKMTIDNEEVLSDNDISIKEEILSPSSTILNNVYPKSWELDKDYTSRFYYPKDYSKLNIQNFNIEPEEAGKTIQVNGSATLTDVDTSKESRVLRILGQTSQTGTPTPSSPIPINVVSGDNEINICGKNLFDYSTNIIDNAYPNNSTMKIATDNNCKMSYLKCEPNTTYIISRRTPMAARFAVATTETTPAIGTTILSFNYNNTGENITITTSANAHYIVIRFIYDEKNDYETYAKTIQVEKGSTATTYEPYIGNTYPLYLGVENLVNVTATTQTINGITFTKNVDNTISVNGTATANTNLNIYSSAIVLKANTNYYLSGCPSGGSSSTYNLQFYSSPTQLRDTGSGLLINRTADTSGYVRIQIMNGTTINNLIFKPQLVEGSTPQHTSTTPVELCKIGTYQDYIYKDNGVWYLHKEVLKVKLTSSMTWYKSGTTAVDKYYTRLNYDFDSSIVRSGSLCNRYKYANNGTNVGEFDYSQNNTVFALFFCYATYNTSTINSFKADLDTNEVICYVPMPTPTNTEITDTTLLEQLESLSS